MDDDPSFEQISPSSSDSWAVLDDDKENHKEPVRICSICGKVVSGVCFVRFSCDLCFVCEACNVKNNASSGLPPCPHQRSLGCADNTEPQLFEFDETLNEKVTAPSDSDQLVITEEPCNPVSAHRYKNEPDDTDIEAISDESGSSDSSEPERPSLAEKVAGIIHCTTPPLTIPGCLGSTAPAISPVTQALSGQRSRQSPPGGNMFDTALSSHSSPGTEFGNSQIGVSATQIDIPKILERKSSTSGSPNSSSPSSTHSSSSLKLAAQFLKSVVIHSAAALNNFDLMPLDALDESCPSSPAKTSQDMIPPRRVSSSAKSASDWRPSPPPNISSLRAANVWDADRFRTLVAPKPVPKSVTENSAYNLR
ncbi:unnamed protein product [Calicophoron daubneyi]|uniref:Uncharacterized protein n=1 Tax=Calicophoron daubneyi TaxID=300641 RepID=A0AAV2TH05_CALDB